MKKVLVFGLIAICTAVIAMDVYANGKFSGKKTIIAPFSAISLAPDPDVQAVQRKLRKLGYYSGYVDGNFGPATVEAVREFQHSKGLKMDGIVGPATQQALGL